MKDYPTRKNPIILPHSFSGSACSIKTQLKAIQKKIIANKKEFQRKNDKIPALWFLPQLLICLSLLFLVGALSALL